MRKRNLPEVLPKREPPQSELRRLINPVSEQAKSTGAEPGERNQPDFRIPAEFRSEPPDIPPPLTNTGSGLTTGTPDDVLQKSVLRCHQPSLSPGHPAAGGRSRCRSGSAAVRLLLGARFRFWLSVGPMGKLIVTVRTGSSGRTDPRRRRRIPAAGPRRNAHARTELTGSLRTRQRYKINTLSSKRAEFYLNYLGFLFVFLPPTC